VIRSPTIPATALAPISFDGKKARRVAAVSGRGMSLSVALVMIPSVLGIQTTPPVVV
jgi:hypothetical protein